MASVLALRAGCAAQAARDRRRRHREVGEEHRKLAAEWRAKKDEKLRGAKPEAEEEVGATSSGGEGSFKSGASMRRTMSQRQATRPDDSLAGGEAEEDEVSDSRQASSLRVQDLVQHLRSNLLGKGNRRATIGLEQYKETLRSTMKDASQGASRKVKAAIALRLKMRRQHTKKLVQLKRAREKRMAELPFDELQAHHRAFDLYTDDDGNLPAEDLIRCLMELGLAGRTRHEKWSVDKLCSQIYYALLKEHDMPVAGAAGGSTGSAGAEASHPNSRRSSARGPLIAEALAAVASSQQTSGQRSTLFNCIGADRRTESLELPISFEDFSAEIVPAARKQLFGIRQEFHFSEFFRLLDQKDVDVVVLTSADFMSLVQTHRLDQDVAKAAINELREAEGLDKAQFNVRTKEATVVPDEVCFDAEVVHDLLMQVEEQTERKKRRIEHEIKDKIGLEDQVFWQYRHELIMLYNTFHHYDDDEDQCLTHAEAKLLLKHLGFQPYRQGPEAEHVQRILVESDEDGNGLVDFLEFLGLMDRIRVLQRADRCNKLREQFIKHRRAHRSADVQAQDLRETLAGIGIPLREDHVELVERVVEELDIDLAALKFPDLEDIAQRVVERLQSAMAEAILQHADKLGLSMDVFAEYQVAFDQLDVDGSGTLSFEEMRRALEMHMGRPPTVMEVEDLYLDLKKNSDEELEIREFMWMMHTASAIKHLFKKGEAFTLRDVPPSKLRDILRLFRLAENYIVKISFEELLEHVANYLEVRTNSDLREELPERVTNVRQLVAYVSKKVEEGNGANGIVSPGPR
mmetsp:Transcript_103733/g.268476  ORF Transcript_103733/g.268476 Transcript_103733/m.268476 type:complete len:802 (-) Transcript_103733:105-2510(-)